MTVLSTQIWVIQEIKTSNLPIQKSKVNPKKNFEVSHKNLIRTTVKLKSQITIILVPYWHFLCSCGWLPEG